MRADPAFPEGQDAADGQRVTVRDASAALLVALVLLPLAGFLGWHSQSGWQDQELPNAKLADPANAQCLRDIGNGTPLTPACADLAREFSAANGLCFKRLMYHMPDQAECVTYFNMLNNPSKISNGRN